MATGGRISAIEVKASRPRGLSSLRRLLEKYPGVPVGHIVSMEPYAVDAARELRAPARASRTDRKRQSVRRAAQYSGTRVMRRAASTA